MKTLAVIILSTLFLLIGCDDGNSILEPAADFDQTSRLDKGRPILNIDPDEDGGYDKLFYLDSTSYGSNSSLRNLDYFEDDARELEDFSDKDSYIVRYSKNFTINGDEGGSVGIKHEWLTDDGKKVRLVSYLKIPSGAFEGDLNFDMIFDVQNNSMELYPSPFSFDKPVEFSMYWYGVDLGGYENDDLDFEYMDEEGEEIICKRKFVDVNSGTLIVQAAQLHHFSRYGWTRTGSKN